MSRLITEASNLLKKMYDRESGLFSYSTEIKQGSYRNTFSHPKAQRYTINTLAGILKVSRTLPNLWDFDDLLDNYLQKQASNIVDPGDRGLMLYVLSNCQHPLATVHFNNLTSLTADPQVYRNQVLQDACWQLYGLISFAKHFQSDEAIALARTCIAHIQRDYMDAETRFPYHQARGLRKRFVSFGGLTYFLKALHDFAKVFDDDHAMRLFKENVRKIISLQGPQGEWAWFYDAKTGQVVEWYEIYSVHQEAMAMLFLLPALDAGVEEARKSIQKSFDWLYGENELSEPIMTDNPFFSYRSIRRRGGLQREKRILRALALSTVSGNGRLAPAHKLEINKECRSYEMGWTLYAWADRNDFPTITNLDGLPPRAGARLQV